MYLKQLEIQGFKSFPDKVKIAFDKGITAIVGPNGSGKSNISDAIRWVLGEMSPKSMRGGKMEDVIFNGTSTRRQASFAEVTMELDNTDRKLACDEDTVFVTRRLYRSGESEYMINKKSTRLKDIVELFLNTGIGKEGYSVIGQGRIAEIISQKSDERRGIFEEAAGISKYKYRKNEAIKKLAVTSENQLRIFDILSETEKRLPVLERQAEKATKYREYIGVKKNLEISLWYERIKTLREERAVNEENCNAQKVLLDKLTEKLEVTENEIDKKYILTQKLNAEASEIQEKLKDITREQGEISAKISVHMNDAEHFSKTLDEQSASIDTAQNSLDELVPQRESLLKEYNDKIESSKTFEQREKALEAHGEELSSELEELSRLKTEKQAKIDQTDEKITSHELLIKSREGFESARKQRITKIDEKIKLVSVQLDVLSAENAEKEQRKKEILENAAEFEKVVDDETQALDTLRGELEDLSTLQQNKRLKLMELNQRNETLKRMERLLEGYAGSVKEIMRAAQDKILVGIHNPVSKIIRSDEKYVVAIETVLGGKMQNIVCENDESAKAAIAFLKRTNSGRATFMPLNTVSGSSFVPVNGVEKMPGYIGTASSVCTYDKIYENVIENLLGRTIVADNIDNAASIAKKLDFRVRIVTLDGQIINAGGSFTGGQTVAKSGILSRNRDILQLSEELKITEAQFNDVSKQYAEKEDAVKACENNLRQAQRELSVVNERIMGIENELKLDTERQQNIRDSIAALENERKEITGGSKTVDEEIADIRGKISSLKTVLDGEKSEYEKLDRQYNKVQSELEKNKNDKTAFYIERESFNGETARMRDKLTSLSVLINNVNQTLESAKKGLEAAKVAISNADKEKSELETALEALKKGEEVIKNDHKSLMEQADNAQKELFDLRASQKSQSIEKESVLSLYTTLKSKLDANNAENDNLISMLWEEYEFTYTDAEKYVAENPTEGDRKEKNRALGEVKMQIKQLGAVNMEAVEQFEEEKKNYAFVKAQYDDIDNAKKELEKLISSIEAIMREMFMRTFEQIRENFKQTFAELFGGGYGEIKLVDNGDILDCGIDINIQPPGKVIKSLSLLSGGEQSFVAIALYFAILNVTPAPFCVFDEIEAALDDTNVYRFGEYMKKYIDNTQFIVITHRRGTMEAADILYGVTMQEKGVTDFLKIDFNQIELKGFKAE
ncbi:MAG: chromosome segregation protein SMC [Ruminococcaceae bacterium]|nr:chromosome segregation protein SMC [Oscillospiraceae bacterium]